MADLFDQLHKDLSIVRLSGQDVRSNSDHWRTFRELVLETEPMYPGIKKWIDAIVGPHLSSPDRVAFLAYHNQEPIVSAVVKRGRRSKFCHLKVRKDFWNKHLGEVFFALMTLEVRHVARQVHFTLPEGLWEANRDFFSSFAFLKTQKAFRQYRLFEEEVQCSASIDRVWEAVVSKIPKLCTTFLIDGYAVDKSLMMSIRPRFADLLLDGSKFVEVRKKFAKRWIGHRVALYASAPTSGLVGEAKIENIVSGDPGYIWEKYGSGIGCQRDEFERYTKYAEKVSAVVMTEVRPYAKTISLKEASELAKEKLRPPQTHCTIDKNSGWAKAVSLSVLLQNRFHDDVPELVEI